jgi:hypothetical protein
MKQKEGPELAACDGMHVMRARIRKIYATNSTHQERGLQLRALMMESYRIATDPNAAREKYEQPSRILPANKFIAPHLEELPLELVSVFLLSTYFREHTVCRLHYRSAESTRNQYTLVNMGVFFRSRTLPSTAISRILELFDAHPLF